MERFLKTCFAPGYAPYIYIYGSLRKLFAKFFRSTIGYAPTYAPYIYIYIYIRVRGGRSRRRTAYKNPWARWLMWAAIVAVSVVVSVVPGGWVAGGWLQKSTFVKHLSLKLTFSKKLLGHLCLKLTFSKSLCT